MNEEKVIDGEFTPVEEVEENKVAPQKPVSMLINDLKDSIVSAINSCGLPLQIVYRVYDELGMEVRQAAEQQAEQERKEYEEALAAYKA